MLRQIELMLAISGALLAGVAPAMAQTPAAASEQKQEKKTVGDRPTTYASTMFFEEELERIDTIMELLKNREPLPNTEEEVAVEAPQATEGPVKTSYTYPQFYLRSIVYHRPDHWVIWVNNQKITSEVPDSILGLTVKRVSREKVTFSYNYAGDALIAEKSGGAGAMVKVDQYNESAEFTISTNQTFSLFNFDVFEGRVAPAVVKINTTPEQQEGDASPPTGNLNVNLNRNNISQESL